MLKHVIALVLLLFIAAYAIGADRPLAGGVPVRIRNDPAESRCIDGAKDRISLRLTRVVTTKQASWFTADKDVSLVINAQVKTDPQPNKPITFPLIANARFGDVPSGQVSIPLEYTIVDGLNLTQQDITYVGLDIEITLLNIRDRNKLGGALQALSSLTAAAKLPIPSSPYTQGLTYLLDFANTTVQRDLDAHNQDDKFVSGSLSLNFDPDGECAGAGGGGFETTGTKAIIYSAGIQGKGYVDIGRTTEYCFLSELTPAFVIKVSPKQGGECPAPHSSLYTDLTNNYIAFFLNKRTVSKQFGPSSISQRDRLESLARCAANGVAKDDCPGGE